MSANRKPMAAFGRETRYVVRLYLMRIPLVVFLVLTLVLALDLAGNFDRVLNAGSAPEAANNTLWLAYYLLLRAEYNLPAILPIATAVSIIWVEYRLARDHEREMIANTGRAPGLSLIPAVLVGLLVGIGQFYLEAYVRPYSVQVQGEDGLRNYGTRFRGGVTAPVWMDVGSALLKTRIRFGADGPMLTNLSLFGLDDHGRLDWALWADGARPGPEGLVLEGAYDTWRDADVSAAAVVPVAVDPAWLSYAGVDPGFVPQPVLVRIAASPDGVPDQTAYRAILSQRRAAIVKSMALTVLVALLCLRLMSPRMSGLLLPVLAGVGYSVFFVGNVLMMLGEYGRISSLLSAWGLPVFLLACCAAYIGLNAWRVRYQLKGLERA